MNATRRLLQHRQPMIQFLGKRATPATIDHTPHPHPESPTSSLPSTWNSFASYRQKAQQHGPLNAPPPPARHIGAHPGKDLGPVAPARGELFDRSELPRRFQRMKWSAAEIEAIESGGASLFA
ncbi:hypothetical protein P152DRAFT_106597 [Eremomyces bilateralis CBS 781.70]|uniref:Ribosomal protein S36, mitochondrial n=1 Tax=Eremomyces bilateralis CBS 781.70 TaxID=1392243 RepID=A0A6G1FWX5_9PEZI|nr:uncharacterized protein P152DRAFT_106597 [Eremomyces bilateralis CBS 781.70]KAF1810274.1 hypothetical protein P152DRAFT_106597 [Eremomyces bilateralis CBS 781.70]